MRVSSLFAVLLISLATCGERQSDKQPLEIRRGQEDKNVKGKRNPWKREARNEMCNEMAKDVFVKSAYVTQNFVQLFLENLDGSRVWTVHDLGMLPQETYPSYVLDSNQRDMLGIFIMDKIQDSQELKTFERVTASFLHFSDGPKEKAYLVVGLNAYEFVNQNDFYQQTGNVKPISDFFDEDYKKLLMPEDKLEEVVSVALIKWVEKDEIKDHAIYKVILKTVTKKLVKVYFNVTNKGEFTSLNSEDFVPSAKVMQKEDEFALLEESALHLVREVDRLSIGYQFTTKFAFPIYYDYNPETNTYKEYQMRTETGFNTELETLGNKVRYWNRYIVPTPTFLGCPDQTFCLGRSFDAVFHYGNQYYAVYGDIFYTFALSTDRPGVGERLRSRFSVLLLEPVNAAFSIGTMVFFIQDRRVDYITNITEKNSERVDFSDLFPGIDADSVSAVITLDNGKEAEEDIPKELVYVYTSTIDSANIYQFKMETTKPPKFKQIAKKAYDEVNAALPMHISLAFIAEGKVVTMFHHFMIEQSSETFYTQTENLAKFTLVDKYFGCERGSLEKELTTDFVQKYVEFAAPKPGENAFTYTTVAQETTKSIAVDEGKTDNKGSSTSALRVTIQVILITLCAISINTL